MDFPKAFNRVWHKGTLYKLEYNGTDGSLLCLLESLLTDIQKLVVLNGQSSNWENVKEGVPQESGLGPLLFLIYINGLPQGLYTDVNWFADDASLSLLVDNIDDSGSKLHKDLISIKNWGYKWKMSFCPSKEKPFQEVIFSRKTWNIAYSNLYFNNLPIVKTASQKYLGLNLIARFTLIIIKMNELWRQWQLLAFYVDFGYFFLHKTSDLDYRDVTYHQYSNASFPSKIESAQ